MKTLKTLKLNELEIKDFKLKKIEGQTLGKIVLEQLLPILQANAPNLTVFLKVGDALCKFCNCLAFWSINDQVNPGLGMGEDCDIDIQIVITKFFDLELQAMTPIEAFTEFVKGCPIKDEININIWTN
jgi:hypothetical protein